MRRYTIRSSLGLLVSGLGLFACGGPSEVDLLPSEEPLGTQLSALCADTSVAIGLDGISTWSGQMAGNGPWSAYGGANSAFLEFYIDGAKVDQAEVCGGSPCPGSGTWYFSRVNVACGSRLFQIKAVPVINLSSGDKYTCTSNVTWLSHTVPSDPTCPPPAPPSVTSLSCSRSTGSSIVTCNASAGGGSGATSTFWSQYRPSTGGSGWIAGGSSKSFYNCAAPTSGARELMEIGFKVRDSNGVEASRITYIECAIGY